ncbi:hypothetical protein GCM10010430_36470 [Kitasatospora cystarginea]|uniref:Uncharacterized protein n=1 Tax=Kitasatospora cystarginea TaxID=58350 RepID=A0ABP5R5S6_9ACTN
MVRRPAPAFGPAWRGLPGDAAAGNWTDYAVVTLQRKASHMPDNYDDVSPLHGLARQAHAWSRPLLLEPSSARTDVLDRLVSWWSHHRDPGGSQPPAAVTPRGFPVGGLPAYQRTGQGPGEGN